MSVDPADDKGCCRSLKCIPCLYSQKTVGAQSAVATREGACLASALASVASCGRIKRGPAIGWTPTSQL